MLGIIHHFSRISIFAKKHEGYFEDCGLVKESYEFNRFEFVIQSYLVIDADDKVLYTTKNLQRRDDTLHPRV